MKSEKKVKKIDNEEVLDYSESDIVEDLSDTQVVKKLRDKLKKVVEEKQEYLEGWQRAKADFVNYKKGEEERRIETLKIAKESFVEEILPVLDSLSLSEGSDAWKSGLGQVNKQLLGILKQSGLEEIIPTGEDFNPNFHEAVEMVEDKKENEGKIIKVIQRGYLLNNKIIRPARVRVGK